MSPDVLLLVIAVVVILVALFLVPTLIQIKSTVQRVDGLVQEAERDLLPMLKELRETSEHVNKASKEAKEGLEKSAPIFQTLGDVGQIAHRYTGFAKGDAGQHAGNIIGMWLGFRAASKILLKELKQTKGGE